MIRFDVVLPRQEWLIAAGFDGMRNSPDLHQHTRFRVTGPIA